MSYYNQRGHGQQNNYRGNTSRNSNSFSEEGTGVKRKRWSRRGGQSGGPGHSDIASPEPLFKEPMSSPRRGSGPNRQSFTREPASKPYFNKRDMPDFVDPEHTGRLWAWETYTQSVKTWQDKHKLAYYRSRCTALEFENQLLFSQINSLIEENSIFAQERGEMPTMRLPDITVRKEQVDEEDGRSNNKQTTPQNKNQGKLKSTSDESSSELEYAIGEDEMEYLEKSIRHKLSLRKQRKEDSEKTKASEENQKKIDDKRVEGPKEPVGKKIKEEFDLLYGDKSSMIQKLETATQLNFNRNYDTYKPEFWMSTPLRIVA